MEGHLSLSHVSHILEPLGNIKREEEEEKKRKGERERRRGRGTRDEGQGGRAGRGYKVLIYFFLKLNEEVSKCKESV